MKVSDHSASLLGENGTARAHLFLAYGAKPESLARMEEFLAAFDDFGSTPSVFLNESDGVLVLGWEDPSDKRVEVEFYPDSYELFLDRSDAELSVPADQLSSLIQAIYEQ